MDPEENEVLQRKRGGKKHTTVGIRWWSPTQLLIYRSEAYVWQSGRDAHFSSVYGRMRRQFIKIQLYTIICSLLILPGLSLGAG